MNQNRDELKRLAQAATPGPWRWGNGPYGWDDGILQANVEVTFGGGVVFTNSGHGGTSPSDTDAAYLAAVSPDVVLELIAAAEGRDALLAMDLFQLGIFPLHSGGITTWKIDCDALTDRDLATIASEMVSEIGHFSAVEGVPTGGLRLADEMRRYVSREGPLLIVDDVLTTGTSMEQQRAGRGAIGVVIFARGECPPWVTPFFVMGHLWRRVKEERDAMREQMRALCYRVDAMAGKPVITRECNKANHMVGHGHTLAVVDGCTGRIPLPEAEAFVAALEWLGKQKGYEFKSSWFQGIWGVTFGENLRPAEWEAKRDKQWSGQGSSLPLALFAALWEMVRQEVKA